MEINKKDKPFLCQKCKKQVNTVYWNRDKHQWLCVKCHNEEELVKIPSQTHRNRV